MFQQKYFVKEKIERAGDSSFSANNQLSIVTYKYYDMISLYRDVV